MGISAYIFRSPVHSVPADVPRAALLGVYLVQTEEPINNVLKYVSSKEIGNDMPDEFIWCVRSSKLLPPSPSLSLSLSLPSYRVLRNCPFVQN